MTDRGSLEGLFAFHGHRCWASTAGVRAGAAALRALGVESSGGKSLHAVVEIGDHHGAMCFADGIQYTTQCTFGKGNIEKSRRGKLAVTLIDTATDRKVRVSYMPTLQPQIRASAFMRKRASGSRRTKSPKPSRRSWSTSSGRRPRTTCLRSDRGAGWLAPGRGGRPLHRVPRVSRTGG